MSRRYLKIDDCDFLCMIDKIIDVLYETKLLDMFIENKALEIIKIIQKNNDIRLKRDNALMKIVKKEIKNLK